MNGSVKRSLAPSTGGSLFASALAFALFGALPSALSLFVSACATDDGTTLDRTGQAAGTLLPARRGAVIVDGCALDTFQEATLASPEARKVLREVVLLCAVPRFDGSVQPGDPSAQAALAALVDALRAEGYSVRIGVEFTDETGARYDGTQVAQLLSDAAWQGRVVAALQRFLADSHAEGLEVDLRLLPAGARSDVTRFFSALSTAIRPGAKLAIFAPPSISDPSDVAGGDAIDLQAIAPQVDRVRVMTLDFSCCGGGPGPTIDTGWAVDAARFAKGLGASDVDVAYPLYGVDFGPLGQRLVTWFEATALASLHRQAIDRGPTGAPFFHYSDGAGDHALWFDDASSTILSLFAWSVLDADVGVVFYGLGAEDPSLWAALSARLP